MNSIVRIKRFQEGKTISEAYLVVAAISPTDLEVKLTTHMNKRDISEFDISSISQMTTRILGGRSIQPYEVDEINIDKVDLRDFIDRKLAARVLRKWTEDFVDEDTNEVVSIDRNEVIINKGVIFDEDHIDTLKASGIKTLKFVADGSDDEVFVYQVSLRYNHDEGRKSPIRKAIIIYAYSVEDCLGMVKHNDAEIDNMDGYSVEVVGITLKAVKEVVRG